MIDPTKLSNGTVVIYDATGIEYVINNCKASMKMEYGVWVEAVSYTRNDLPFGSQMYVRDIPTFCTKFSIKSNG